MLSQPVAFALLTDNVVKPLEEAIIKDHVLEFVPGLAAQAALDFAARACKLDRDGSSTGRLCPRLCLSPTASLLLSDGDLAAPRTQPLEGRLRKRFLITFSATFQHREYLFGVRHGGSSPWILHEESFSMNDYFRLEVEMAQECGEKAQQIE